MPAFKCHGIFQDICADWTDIAVMRRRREHISGETHDCGELLEFYELPLRFFARLVNENKVQLQYGNDHSRSPSVVIEWVSVGLTAKASRLGSFKEEPANLARICADIVLLPTYLFIIPT
jgi:hypothetical protein